MIRQWQLCPVCLILLKRTSVHSCVALLKWHEEPEVLNPALFRGCGKGMGCNLVSCEQVLL